ncbi:MAG: PAS domain-containing protein [Deltaproteobacteria bacterium]|nr:PAS domain-containing protein [Deltaproteobacteria bacterium]
MPRDLSEDFERFAQRSRDVVYRFDVAAREYRFWNQVGLLTFGGRDGPRAPTRQDVLGLILPEDRDRVRQTSRDSLAIGRDGSEVEYRIRCPDGSVRWMHDRWTVIRDPEGRPLAIEGVVRDDTERRQAEDALRQMNRSHEDLIRALRVLLAKREQDRADLRRSLAEGFRELVEPYLQQLKSTPLTGHQTTLLSVVEAHLARLLGGEEDGERSGVLSAAEARVASLVRIGKSTKEIASLLNVSIRTVESHRYTIRQKLGLRRTQEPLQAHLKRGGGGEGTPLLLHPLRTPPQ